MSFEFLGTFTKSQFDRFSAFVRAQTQTIDQRVQHLQAELNRVGSLVFTYDSGGVPTGFSFDEDTYIGNLFSVYEALGGDAFYDLQVRSASQPIYKLTGDETHMPQQMSNGEVIGTPGLSDAASAELLRQARDWTWDNLYTRREALERKIRRALDYSDQLQSEINNLLTIRSDVTIENSLEFLLTGVQQLISDRQYMAAQDDSSKADPHGKLAYAPFASYMPGPDQSQVTDFERTFDGQVVPTGSSSG